MEAYATWVRLFELLPHYSWIVDRFHVSTMAYQQAEHDREDDFGWLEERILPLGFHIVLCRRPDTFEVARTERLTISGRPDQYDDLSVFVREQERLRSLAARSRLPVLELDMTDGDLDQASSTVADWLESTGGLWAPASAER
jgi:thymidylate kinase